MANRDKKTPLGKTIRQLGEGTITKPELKDLTDKYSSGQFIQKLDKINQNLKGKDQVGISLGSGATNMLIREASKQSPTGYDAYQSLLTGKHTLGTGKLGTELQRRASEFGTTGSMGSLVPKGMTTMPSGRLSLPGIGNQYTYGGGGKGPYDETNMPITPPTPGVGPGPWAPGTTQGGGGTDTLPGGDGTDTVTPTTEFDPYDFIGTKFWRALNKKQKRGLKSTFASSASGATRSMPTSSTLGM